MLTITRLTDPTYEPVSLAALRDWCRIDDPIEDVLLTGLLRAARQHLEDALGYVYLTSTWRILLDAPVGTVVRLPLRPLQAVTRVAWVDTDGVWTDWTDGGSPPGVEADYLVDLDPPRLTRVATTWPSTMRPKDNLLIEVTAGHASIETVPAALNLAVAMLVAHWYEARTPLAGAGGRALLPYHIEALLHGYKPVGVIAV